MISGSPITFRIVSSDDVMRSYESDGGPAVAAAAEGVPGVPALKTAIVSCMDTRIDVMALFGLGLGQVHVLRNAGGVVTDDTRRSITISQRKLGTRDVIIIRHKGCGLATFANADFMDELAGDTGMRPSWQTYAFTDPATGVREDVESLRRDPFLHPDTRVRGFVLDIETYTLEEVTPGR